MNDKKELFRDIDSDNIRNEFKKGLIRDIQRWKENGLYEKHIIRNLNDEIEALRKEQKKFKDIEGPLNPIRKVEELFIGVANHRLDSLVDEIEKLMNSFGFKGIEKRYKSIISKFEKLLDELDPADIPNKDSHLQAFKTALHVVIGNKKEVAIKYLQIEQTASIRNKIKKGNIGVLLEDQKEIRISSNELQSMVKKANELLRSEPEVYKPYRNGTFLSDNLKRALAEEFDLAESTTYERMNNYSHKEGDYYKLNKSVLDKIG